MWANFISHCDNGAIFHNFRKKIISHSTQVKYFTKNYKLQFYPTSAKERNPKLLPIGDGFGFLLFFGDLS